MRHADTRLQVIILRWTNFLRSFSRQDAHRLQHVLRFCQSVRKYTIEEIKAIKAEYRAKTRELKRAAA